MTNPANPPAQTETATTAEPVPPTEPAQVTEPVKEPAAPVEPATGEPADPGAAATGTDPLAEIQRLQAEANKWQALSRKNEARAKENADKAQKYTEIEEANKTEVQRLTDRVQKAETELQQARTLALRAEKSASTGVPMALIPSGTEDEMDSAIAAYQGALSAALNSRNAQTPPAAPANLVTAPEGSTKVKQLTRADLQSMSPQEIVQAKNDGRLNELLGKST
ncbi:putative bacteriophage protein [Nocardia nova SH22a]|uniref:Putative bacteriophage protein n=1 Tax=Nocardia nova SH22a TaxID=1415166 RepID=W5TNY3_9NOCA|nr:hypothetical protein [Nocardia nova]AHH20849.1 putative bacteriophage protein [Nocardia nova SH22a]